MKSKQEIKFDEERARTTIKTSEFIATFATLLLLLWLDWGWLFTFVATLAAYAITNLVLIIRLDALGAKFKTIFDFIFKK